MEYMTKELDSFIESNLNVMVIKGDWGVGKTELWKKYIKNKIQNKDLKKVAYSYTSLFGKNSIKECQRTVFHNAEFLNGEEEINEKIFSKKNFEKYKNKIPGLNKATKHIDKIPILNKYSNLISNFEYSLVENYLVCFDDLERKSDSLSVKEIMGLIDELSQVKQCKIILIFNENSLSIESDKKQFETYREKIVDIELTYNPTCEMNLGYVFKSNMIGFKTLEKTILHLNIRNIRILKKLNRMHEHFSSYLKEKDEIIISEFLQHATVLTWGYFSKNDKLSYNELKEQVSKNSWISNSLKDKDFMSEAEKSFLEIATALELSPSKFHATICFYLEHGYIDHELTNDIIMTIEENLNKLRIKEKLNNAWEIYSKSLLDNFNEFHSALIQILETDIDMLELPDFIAIIAILDEFKIEVDDYINTYVDNRTISGEDLAKYITINGIKNKKLLEKLEPFATATQRNISINDITMRLVQGKGWKKPEIDFLSKLTEENYYKWIQTNPKNLSDKLKALLSLKGITESEMYGKQFIEIITNLENSLKRLAKENDFNKYRVENIYNIDCSK